MDTVKELSIKLIIIIKSKLIKGIWWYYVVGKGVWIKRRVRREVGGYFGVLQRRCQASKRDAMSRERERKFAHSLCVLPAAGGGAPTWLHTTVKWSHPLSLSLALWVSEGGMLAINTSPPPPTLLLALPACLASPSQLTRHHV
jgi:hypothetical protein